LQPRSFGEQVGKGRGTKQMSEKMRDQQEGASPSAAKNRAINVRPKNCLIPLVLMSLWQANSSYGYELIERTASFWEEALNPGTMYRTLRQMENNGDIQSTWQTNGNGPARRMYSITDAGVAYLDLWLEALEQYQRNMDAFFQIYHRPPDREDT
jgi:PadR family transcriptional regulator